MSLVHEIHREIKKLEENKRKIVIGDHGHDEVVAIANQVKILQLFQLLKTKNEKVAQSRSCQSVNPNN